MLRAYAEKVCVYVGRGAEDTFHLRTCFPLMILNIQSAFLV